MSVETWKWVPGFEGRYKVSNAGNVMSFAHKREGRLLKPGRASNGYLTVAIGRGNSKTVHSLVALAFLGAKPHGCEVLHLDGTRTNNRLSNLRYGTRTENIHDAVKHGTWMTPARKAHLKKVGFGGRTSL